MTLRVCLACSTAYAVGLARCPNCTSPDSMEEGEMPKISKAQGASNGEPVAVAEPELADELADELAESDGPVVQLFVDRIVQLDEPEDSDEGDDADEAEPEDEGDHSEPFEF